MSPHYSPPRAHPSGTGVVLALLAGCSSSILTLLFHPSEKERERYHYANKSNLSMNRRVLGRNAKPIVMSAILYIENVSYFKVLL